MSAWLLLVTLFTVIAAGTGEDEGVVAFVGLHGGVFAEIEELAPALDLQVVYLRDEDLESGRADLSGLRLVLIQHMPSGPPEHYREMFESACSKNEDLRILSISGLAEPDLPGLVDRGLLISDPNLAPFYGNSKENLRRLLQYLAVTYLGREGEALPPLEVPAEGLYHPDHEGLFQTSGELSTWEQERGLASARRALVVVHHTHLMFQQPAVVDALIRALERRGFRAAGIIDTGERYEELLESLAPDVLIHTCHSRDSVRLRESIDAPHLHSIFFRTQSIEDWRSSGEGIAASEAAFHVLGQEIRGAIEPQIGAGTILGGGSDEAFTPIDERIEHLAARADAWSRLRHRPEAEKKIAFVYWDRELGKAELMRGSATGMFLNGPRSMIRVLRAMKDAGYRVDPLPESEDQLVAWMMDHGRQIGIWAEGTLERLAESGDAVLIPLERYRGWFEEKVPEEQRRELIERWGPPPGRFSVYERGDETFLVIPRIDLGNVVLLPQPLRGEAHDTSLVHDKRVPPPHNYLATYFWLQEEMRADAVVHFGTHGTEFLLPAKAIGLSRHDWPDMLLGEMPNINPWVINNLGESGPDRRRAYSVLIDHLVPPSVAGGLSDELLDLHGDIDKWVTLDEGALKEKFESSITKAVIAAKLDQDLGLELDDRQITAEEIDRVQEYLHELHEETTPVSLHVMGVPPKESLRTPWIVTCLRKKFLDALGEVLVIPPGEDRAEGDREKYLRQKAEEIIALHLRRDLAPIEALIAAGAAKSVTLSKDLEEGFTLAGELEAGFLAATDEVDNLLRALDGRFIAPGPGGGPDRNPGSVPTGRNLYVMNPEEVPARESWELGRELVDQMLRDRLEIDGQYPRKVAFTLNSFATFQDYGVMESQILYLLGVRPVWDSRNLVAEVELIPREELGRPRIDVFIAALSYYRDMLPTRMHLIDRAIRLVADVEEEDNLVREGTLRVRSELIEAGVPEEAAKTLSQGRLFGYPPGQYGSAGYYYLVERSGEWGTREDLMDVYLGQVSHIYTEGAWGDAARAAYERHIQQSDVLLRSWSDRTRSPLSNKYVWYHGGSLSRAIEQLTGKKPVWYLSDVRDPDAARMVDAEAALRADFRVRLFNRKWIEGMMKEGYAGADQVATHVTNAMGWEIMREDSVSDEMWMEIVDIYLRDRKDLHIREWFEAENPYAFQEMTEVLLETIRKGYWQPHAETVAEIAEANARSVLRHGEGEGLRGGGNVDLRQFVAETLTRAGLESLVQCLEAAPLAEASEAEAVETPEADSPEAEVSDAAPERSEAEPEAPPIATEAEPVRGRKMERVPSPIDAPLVPRWLIITGVFGLLLLGAWRKVGSAR